VVLPASGATAAAVIRCRDRMKNGARRRRWDEVAAA